jgi:hypothetical protein
VLRIFIALKKSIASAGFEPATVGSSGKHTNHYTTKATHYTRYSTFKVNLAAVCAADAAFKNGDIFKKVSPPTLTLLAYFPS